MKMIFFVFLFFIASCDGGRGSGGANKGSEVVTPGGITDAQVAHEFIQQSNQTLPSELKLSSSDSSLIQSELELTADEINSLNQLQN